MARAETSFTPSRRQGWLDSRADSNAALPLSLPRRSRVSRRHAASRGPPRHWAAGCGGTAAAAAVAGLPGGRRPAGPPGRRPLRRAARRCPRRIPGWVGGGPVADSRKWTPSLDSLPLLKEPLRTSSPTFLKVALMFDNLCKILLPSTRDLSSFTLPCPRAEAKSARIGSIAPRATFIARHCVCLWKCQSPVFGVLLHVGLARGCEGVACPSAAMRWRQPGRRCSGCVLWGQSCGQDFFFKGRTSVGGGAGVSVYLLNFRKAGKGPFFWSPFGPQPNGYRCPWGGVVPA